MVSIHTTCQKKTHSRDMQNKAVQNFASTASWEPQKHYRMPGWIRAFVKGKQKCASFTLLPMWRRSYVNSRDNRNIGGEWKAVAGQATTTSVMFRMSLG